MNREWPFIIFCKAKTITHRVKPSYGRLKAMKHFFFRTKKSHNIIKLWYSLLVTVTETKSKFIKNELEKNQEII